MKTAHVHPATCNLAHLLTRHVSPTIYRCFALPKLLYTWRHQSGIFWIHPHVLVCVYVCNIVSKADSYSEELLPPPRPQSAGPPIVGCGCIFIPTVTSHICRNNSTMLQNNPQLSNSLFPIGGYLYNTHISSLSQHHSL
jgi:hypothetical protein